MPSGAQPIDALSQRFHYSTLPQCGAAAKQDCDPDGRAEDDAASWCRSSPPSPCGPSNTCHSARIAVISTPYRRRHGVRPTAPLQLGGSATAKLLLPFTTSVLSW